MSYTRILCAIDVRDPSEAVIGTTLTLARQFKAEVVVTYVRRPEDVAARLFGALGKRARSGDLLQELVSTRFSGLNARGHLLSGDAGREIVRLAHDTGCDLIVMGSHGRLGLGKLLGGSVSDFVVRHAAMPVVTIAPERDPEEIKIADPMPNF